jgi:hypothetical protein
VRIHHAAGGKKWTPRYTNIIGVCRRVLDAANMQVRWKQSADRAGVDLGVVRCAVEGSVDTELLSH